MRRIHYIGGFLSLWALVAVGCAGMGGDQQPRLEIGEPAKGFLLRPHHAWSPPSIVSLSRRTDGSFVLRTRTSHSEKWARQIITPNAEITLLRDALRPYLSPVCEERR